MSIVGTTFVLQVCIVLLSFIDSFIHRPFLCWFKFFNCNADYHHRISWKVYFHSKTRLAAMAYLLSHRPCQVGTNFSFDYSFFSFSFNEVIIDFIFLHFWVVRLPINTLLNEQPYHMDMVIKLCYLLSAGHWRLLANLFQFRTPHWPNTSQSQFDDTEVHVLLNLGISFFFK